MTQTISIRFPVFSVFYLLIAFICHPATAETNADYVYFTNGDTPDNWTWVAADPSNWWVPIEGNEGKSKSGKVKIKPIDFKGKGDAVTISWSRKDNWGNMALQGRTVDLSKFEKTGELAIAIKMDKKPNKPVKLTLECGENCKAEIQIKDMLREAPVGQWFALPIPLDCYKQKGADLSKVTSPFSIGTDGILTISIAEIRLQQMASGDQGCIPNSEQTEE